MKQEINLKKFRSPLEAVNVKTECCSSHIIEDFGFDISKYGEAKVYKKGETDFYQLIQAYKDTADLKIVLTQVRQTGDTSLLNQRKGVFGDSSELPASFIEAYNVVKTSKDKVLKEMSSLTDTDYSNFSDKDLKNLSQETIAQQVYQKVMKQINNSNLEKGGISNE